MREISLSGLVIVSQPCAAGIEGPDAPWKGTTEVSSNPSKARVDASSALSKS